MGAWPGLGPLRQREAYSGTGRPSSELGCTLVSSISLLPAYSMWLLLSCSS